MVPALFYFFSGLALCSALAVVFQPKPVRALLCLVVTMFCLSALYLMLGAPFVAMVNLIVYAGAILVLFLFVIMLQGIGAVDTPLRERFHPLFLLTCGFVAVAFTAIMLVITLGGGLLRAIGIHASIQLTAHTLFREYLLPFELTSILLLIGIFAAVSLAKKENP